MILKLAKADDWVTLKTANNAFASTIRLGIKPISYRKFDAATNQWYVHKKQVPLLIKLAHKFYQDIDVSQIPQNWITGEVEKDVNSYAALYLTPEAPQSVVRAVYEVLVSECHPDHNDGLGDPVRLQEVMAAYKNIKIK